MTILGIETTCDETAVGIVRDGREVLDNVVSSSLDLQQKYRGVVPEIAAREQVRTMIPVLEEALRQAQCKPADIEAIAVAAGPGLVGSLLVGVETAKTLALVWNKPLIAVNHLIGHVYANWLTPVVNRKSLIVNRKSNKPINHSPLTINFPLVALIVSGGHTDLLLMTGHGRYRWLGGTRDDAAGEAFDKVARILGLGYPGGPEVEKVASQRDRFPSEKQSVKSKSSFKLPRPMIDSPDFDFSFSGIKTAVVNLIQKSKIKDQNLVEETAHEFQQAIVEVLVTKTVRAAKKFGVKSIIVGGGVAANSVLRSQLTVHSLRIGVPVFFPSKELSIDNGAMIAAAAFWQKKFVDPLKLQANPSLYFLQ